MQLSSNISKVFAVIFLKQQDGSRFYSKYYLKHFPSSMLRVSEGSLENIEVQKNFEKGIWEKGKRVGSRLARPSESEIFQYSQFNIIMKAFNEINLYVVGDFDENEIILSQVSQAIYETLNIITRDHISKKGLQDNFDQLIIVIDEILDDGIVITTDPQVIYARATMKDCDQVVMQTAESGGGSFSSVFASAKRQFQQQFMSST